MKGWKTFVFFGAVAVLGLVTMLESANIQGILLPALCHVDPASEFVPNDCTAKVVSITGALMTGIAVVGKVLRFVTTSAIFKPE